VNCLPKSVLTSHFSCFSETSAANGSSESWPNRPCRRKNASTATIYRVSMARDRVPVRSLTVTPMEHRYYLYCNYHFTESADRLSATPMEHRYFLYCDNQFTGSADNRRRFWKPLHHLRRFQTFVTCPAFNF